MDHGVLHRSAGSYLPPKASSGMSTATLLPERMASILPKVTGSMIWVIELGALDLPFVEGGVLLLGSRGQRFRGDPRTPQEHPPHDHVAAHFQERVSVGGGGHQVAVHGGHAHVPGDFFETEQCLLHLLRHRGGAFDLGGGSRWHAGSRRRGR